MSLFRDLDLYKVIILISLLLLPVSLGFVYWVEGEVERAQAALVAAEGPGAREGEIEKIGMLQRQLETVEKNASKERAAGGSHAVFFQQQIQTSSDNTLSTNDYEIGPELRAGVGGQKNAQDQEVTITFRSSDRKPKPLPRDFIHAMIFNIEASGAQVWKLRQLQMRNVDLAQVSQRKEMPEKTVSDLWEIRALKFARREPDQTSRR